MSSPSSRMRPADGRSTPVSRLMTVVLPAPLGPISAWRAPFSILSDRPATAVRPPKCFSRPTVSSTAAMVSALRPAGPRPERCAAGEPTQHARGERRARPRSTTPDAVAADQNDQHQHETDPELPVLRGQVGDPVLHQLEDHGADQAAVEIAGAADDQHQQQVGGTLERKHVERGEGGGLRQQRAGDAGIERRRACRRRPAAH